MSLKNLRWFHFKSHFCDMNFVTASIHVILGAMSASRVRAQTSRTGPCWTPRSKRGKQTWIKKKALMVTAGLLSKDVGSNDQQSDLAQCFEALLPVVWARWYGRLKKETGPRFIQQEQEEHATCSPAGTWLFLPCSATWGKTMILVDDKTYFLKGRYRWYGGKKLLKKTGQNFRSSGQTAIPQSRKVS